MSSLVGDNPATADLLRRLGGGGGLAQSYLATIIALLGLVASAYAITGVLRLRGEEMSGRAEPLLVADGARIRPAAAHLLIAVAGLVMLLALAGLAAGVTYGRSVHDVGGQVPALLGACLAQAPGAAVLAGLALAVVGVLPRASLAVWPVLAVCLLLGQLGAELRLPQAVRDLSPYTQLPLLPGGSVHALPLVLLVVVALTFAAAGLVGWRRRDIG